VDETHHDQPVTVYDLHKWIAENYLKHYAREGVVRGTTLRLSNVYGPGPKSSSADRGVLNAMIRKALNGEPLTVYGKGDNLRDYVYVQDVVRAFLMAVGNIESVNGQHFVIGSGQGYTLAEVFNLVADGVSRKTGQRVPVIHIEPPTLQSVIEARNFVADSSKFSRATCWQATYPLPVGIALTIESFLQ
jgi:nucleoside-diphosphate-sugar epimerase